MSGPVFLRNVLLTTRNLTFKRSCSSEPDIIKIPKRIHRGPTDILRALSRTHKRDPSSTHYKYHDDPYLTPYSNSNKRSYALALEAGRKSAHWVRQEHAELFNHSVADPNIELFIPSKVYNEDTEVTLEDLKKTLSNFAVSDSITVYKSLEKKGIEIDGETKQSLLELLCFYNGDDGVDEAWLEERWFRSNHKRRDLLKNTWKVNGEAEQVFRSIKPPTPEAYCAIISGMAKFGQADGAMKLLEEAKSNNVPLSVVVYNSILARICFLKNNPDLMWNMVLELLVEMNSKGLSPNLGTFNAVLETLSFMSGHRHSRKYALQLLAEMKNLNIEPSLGSFFHLLNIYYNGSQNSGVLHDIVDHLDGKPSEVRDINDSMFFVTAMEMCRHKLHLVSLGYRIHKMLLQDENYNLIGDSFRESQYYRFLFSLVCEGEPLDEFMNIYDELVPHLYTPEPSVMMEVLNSIEINFGYKYIPKLWTDMTRFDLADRQHLLIKVLELMTQTDDQELNLQFVNIGWSIWEKVEGQTRDRNLIEWTGGMLSDLLRLFVKNKEHAKANLIFDKLNRQQNNLTGEPDMGALRSYVVSCIENQSYDVAIKCVGYCLDMGFGEATEFANLIETAPSVTDQQKQRLNTIMGKLPST